MKTLTAALIGGLTFATATHAHTPYLAPGSFEPVIDNYVTLDASFAERFFIPEAAFSGSIYRVTTPLGTTKSPDNVTQLKTRMVVEHQLSDKGTYKFTTGSRLGRVFKSYELDGKRHGMKDPTAALPKGAKLLNHFQSITTAETYVSRGAPSNKAIKRRNHGLEIYPVTHPNEVYAGEDFTFQVFFEGQALSDQKLDIFHAEGAFSKKDAAYQVTTNAKGEASFNPKDAGLYLMRARHRAKAPKGSPAPEYSHTYTLVLEAAR